MRPAAPRIATACKFWIGQAAGLCLVLAHATVAVPDELSGRHWMSIEAMRAEFSGKALAGTYPGGKAWSEMIFADGTTDYREGILRRSGKWWMTGQEFCFSYPPPGIGGCFRSIKMSANCYELYDFSSGDDRPGSPLPQSGAWNGQMWRTEAPATCGEKPSA